jgi:ribonuclease HI
VGLRIERDVMDSGQEMREMVVKSDSEYLVNGVTEWVVRWLGNGCLNSRGVEVVNKGLFEMLSGLVQGLERGQQVLF